MELRHRKEILFEGKKVSAVEASAIGEDGNSITSALVIGAKSEDLKRFIEQLKKAPQDNARDADGNNNWVIEVPTIATIPEAPSKSLPAIESAPVHPDQIRRQDTLMNAPPKSTRRK